MNTLAARHTHSVRYPLPHADFLRLQHAHRMGVTILDMIDQLSTLDMRRTPEEQGLASVLALLTDQLGSIVDTCEALMFADMEDSAHDHA